jgi:DNA replication protein DnaC
MLTMSFKNVRDLEAEDRGSEAEDRRREAIRAAAAASDFEAWKEHKIAEYVAEQTWFHSDAYHPPLPEKIERFAAELPMQWREEQRWREERKKARLAEFLKAMPQRAAEFALATSIEDPLIKRVADWKEKQRDGGILVLSGPAGVGKTVAACWWANGFDRVPMFMRASEFATTSRYDHDARENWQKQRALILDDLGAEYLDPKGSFLVDLDELVDFFYADKKYLLITTNCDKATFKARYGERITDRLSEAGTWIAVPGASRRKKAKQ